MRSTFKEKMQEFVGGMTLSTLFFQPLIGVLVTEKIDLLHWAKIDSILLIFSWLFIGVIIFLGLHICKKISQKIYINIILLLLEIGLLMLFAQMLRHEVVTTLIKNHPFTINTIILICTIANIGLFFKINFIDSKKTEILLDKIILLLSPVIIIFIFHISNVILDPKFNHNLNETRIVNLSTNSQIEKNSKVIILLFDELSPDFLYGSKKVDLNSYPSLQHLVQNSNQFLNVHLAGGQTSLAIENLLNNKFSGLNLKYFLENRDINSSVMGWSLNYCANLVPKNKSCNSTSIYNSRTLNNDFSLINPVWTNFNLLPYVKPYGFIKIPTATEIHRKTYEKNLKWLSDQLEDPKSELIFVHFNIPHPPLLDNVSMGLFDSKKYNVSEESYTNQFVYIDHTIKLLLEKTTQINSSNDSTIIVISDHNIRSLTPKNLHENITLLIYPRKTEKDFDDESNNKITPSEIIIPTLVKFFKGKI